MSKKTAVVIDDEVDLTTFISSILEESGFSVRTANDAETGETMIREDGGTLTVHLKDRDDRAPGIPNTVYWSLKKFLLHSQL